MRCIGLPTFHMVTTTTCAFSKSMNHVMRQSSQDNTFVIGEAVSAYQVAHLWKEPERATDRVPSSTTLSGSGSQTLTFLTHSATKAMGKRSELSSSCRKSHAGAVQSLANLSCAVHLNRLLRTMLPRVPQPRPTVNSKRVR